MCHCVWNRWRGWKYWLNCAMTPTRNTQTGSTMRNDTDIWSDGILGFLPLQISLNTPWFTSIGIATSKLAFYSKLTVSNLTPPQSPHSELPSVDSVIAIIARINWSIKILPSVVYFVCGTNTRWFAKTRRGYLHFRFYLNRHLQQQTNI